jgi:hypothetical protein
LTRSVWPASVARTAPVLASHTRAVLSHEAVTTRPPSGLNAALFIQNLCPDSVAVTAPVCAFHTRAVPSQDDVTTLAPSGLKAALLTRPLCPANASRKVQSCAEPKNDRSSCSGRD